LSVSRKLDALVTPPAVIEKVGVVSESSAIRAYTGRNGV